ncbi:MAG: hypothetical protein H7Y07_14490 [Pyrinomonadaceae bacterium]|nr:hypothetical protein [Sphingobacteriaceae bacterium]
MKIAFKLLFCLFIFVVDLLLSHQPDLNPAKEIIVYKASLDGNIVYALVTASILGVVKLKRNAPSQKNKGKLA